MSSIHLYYKLKQNLPKNIKNFIHYKEKTLYATYMYFQNIFYVTPPSTSYTKIRK